MTLYVDNIHYTDTRTGAPLKAVLDSIFKTIPGIALLSKIKACSPRRVTVKYKHATAHRDIKTSATNAASGMTKLSVASWHMQNDLRSGPPKPLTLQNFTTELKKYGVSSAFAIANRAGKGPDPSLKWTYPAMTGTTLQQLFTQLLNGTINVWQALGKLRARPGQECYDWSARLSADLHQGLHSKLNKGTGSSVTIEFDEDYAGKHLAGGDGVNRNDSIASVVLAHELVHAYLALSGAGIDCGLGKLEDVYVIGLNNSPSICCENTFRIAFSMTPRSAV